MKKILVVDNLLAMGSHGVGLMSRANLNVVTAPDAAAALDMHRTEKADLIVLDMQVQGMSPEAFCNAVRQDIETRATSILIVCRDTASEIDRALRCRVNDYITRPLDDALLARKVGELLSVSERKGCRILLRVVVDGEKTGGQFFCTSQNISMSGMLIKTEKKLESGEKISCSFFLPGSERIAAEAEVVRAGADPDGTWLYGIRFLDLSSVYRSHLDAFISSREK